MTTTGKGNDLENEGYKIIDQYLFEDNVGFVFAHNPKAPSPYVTWRFDEKHGEGKKDYYWGHYFENEIDAKSDLEQRVQERISSYQIRCHGMDGVPVLPKDEWVKFLDRVLLFEPEKEPRLLFIRAGDHSELSRITGGQWHQGYALPSKNIAIYTNVDAEYSKEKANRMFTDETGEKITVYGKFLVIGRAPEFGYVSLSWEQVKTAPAIFENPPPPKHKKRDKPPRNKGGRSR